MSYLFPGVYGTNLAYYQIPSLSTSSAATLAALLAGLTPAGTIPSGATMAVLQVEGQDIRWRTDGVAPTSSIGMFLLPNTEGLALQGAQFRAIQLIGVSAGAILNVSFFS